jgi:hypothetical protein
MVLNTTFNNISAILWQSVLLVEETGEKHQPIASHWQTYIEYNLEWVCTVIIRQDGKLRETIQPKTFIKVPGNRGKNIHKSNKIKCML